MVNSTLTDNDLLKILERFPIKPQSENKLHYPLDLLRTIANEAATRAYTDLLCGYPPYLDESAIADWIIFFLGIAIILGLVLVFLLK